MFLQGGGGEREESGRGRGEEGRERGEEGRGRGGGGASKTNDHSSWHKLIVHGLTCCGNFPFATTSSRESPSLHTKNS